ncbi:MAG: 3-keto-5-aminohexanoate cleavage protein [Geminicoccaceae bacterium]
MLAGQPASPGYGVLRGFIGRMQLPFVAMAALAGGNVRVGLEDNIYLARHPGYQRPAGRAGGDDPDRHGRADCRPFRGQSRSSA